MMQQPISSAAAKPTPELSIVIPCYNEGASIETVALEWLEGARALTPRFEIVLVNDGSNDGTGRILDILRRAHKEIRIIHQLHIGHGKAIRRGYEESRGRYICQVDGNGRFNPEDLSLLWEHRNDYHLVLAVRTRRNERGMRLFLSHLMRRAIAVLFGVRLGDPNSPLRLISRPAIQAYLRSVPAGIEAVNLCLSVLIAYGHPDAVAEVLVPHRSRAHGRSHLRPGGLFSRAWQFGGEILGLRWRLRKRLPPLASPPPLASRA